MQQNSSLKTQWNSLNRRLAKGSIKFKETEMLVTKINGWVWACSRAKRFSLIGVGAVVTATRSNSPQALECRLCLTANTKRVQWPWNLSHRSRKWEAITVKWWQSKTQANWSQHKSQRMTLGPPSRLWTSPLIILQHLALRQYLWKRRTDRWLLSKHRQNN